MAAVPARKPSPFAKEAQKVKSQLETLIAKMQKDNHFTPTREQLEDPAEALIDLISRHHTKVASYASHLKAAIIDLTEVPVMSPQMQRIAFLTALKDASQKIDLFLSCC
jgi:hypothetical protein